MKQNNPHRKSERGSAIFYILIAVAMFATLNMAVSNMMRDGTAEKISESKSGLFAQEILDYGREMVGAVQQMRISEDCRDTDISFTQTGADGYEHSPVVRDECKVFDLDGGAIVRATTYDDWLDISESARDLYGEFYFPEEACIVNVGTGGAGCAAGASTEQELMLVVPWLKEEICSSINDFLGLSSAIPVNAGSCWDYGVNDKFNGTYVAGHRWAVDNLAQCIQCTGDPNSGYHFFQVLIAR